ncbi:hypothetical protein OROMI_030688 [Orobanche minor]
MGFTKEQLLARLQELQIVFSQYEHPVVLTVEAQAKYVGCTKGGLSKNLFLKDKKHRFYVVSALAETKVDLKVLSQRLGLGKGGLRMAPEEALAEILQVPLGCVTPLALVNDSARTLNAHDLGKFLISIGRTPTYVDLEANPMVGKDQPPDLAALVPSDAKALGDHVEEQGATQGSEKNQVSSNNQPDVVTVAKAVKPSKAFIKEKASDVVKFSATYADTDKFVEEILEKTKSIVLSEIKDENMENNWEQLAIIVSNNISKLGVELKNVAMIFKNTAYTEGFTAGIHRQPNRM